MKSRREPQLRAPDFATPQLGVPPSGAAELAEKKALRHPAGQEESVSDSTPSAEVQGVSARAGATRDYAVRRFHNYSVPLGSTMKPDSLGFCCYSSVQDRSLL